MTSKNLVIGVDLGRLVDHSAVCITERYQLVRDLPFPTRTETEDRYQVLALRRFPLLTSYTTVVRDIGAMMQASGLEDAVLAIDATGIGRDVWLMFAHAYKAGMLGNHWPWPYFIAGNGSSETHDTYRRVTKVDLVGKLIATLEGQKLEIPATLPDAPHLEQELSGFRRKISQKGTASFAADGTREHDDLVSALMLSLWHRHSLAEPRTVAAQPVGA